MAGHSVQFWYEWYTFRISDDAFFQEASIERNLQRTCLVCTDNRSSTNLIFIVVEETIEDQIAEEQRPFAFDLFELFQLLGIVVQPRGILSNKRKERISMLRRENRSLLQLVFCTHRVETVIDRIGLAISR